MPRPLIIVHGGAGVWSDEYVKDGLSGVKAGAQAGWKILGCRGSALDAVEAAVTSLEDNPVFNAGTGSHLTTDREIEEDALIMCGKTLKSGGVTCVKNIKNPIQLSRHILDKSKHVVLAGEGANKFAEQIGMHTVPIDELITDRAEKTGTT